MERPSPASVSWQSNLDEYLLFSQAGRIRASIRVHQDAYAFLYLSTRASLYTAESTAKQMRST